MKGVINDFVKKLSKTKNIQVSKNTKSQEVLVRIKNDKSNSELV